MRNSRSEAAPRTEHGWDGAVLRMDHGSASEEPREEPRIEHGRNTDSAGRGVVKSHGSNTDETRIVCHGVIMGSVPEFRKTQHRISCAPPDIWRSPVSPGAAACVTCDWFPICRCNRGQPRDTAIGLREHTRAGGLAVSSVAFGVAKSRGRACAST